LASCGETKNVDVTLDPPAKVRVEEMPYGSSLRDFRRSLSPEVVGARAYLFSMSWRNPKNRSDSFRVWTIEDGMLNFELLTHPGDPDFLFSSRAKAFTAGKTYEIHIDVLTDGEMEKIFYQQTLEARQDAFNANSANRVRSIKVHLE